MGCFSSSTRNAPAQDPFEADTIRALEASRIENERNEIERAKKESLRLAEEEEANRKLKESKEKGKSKQVVDDDQVEDKGQTKHSKDHVNTPPPPPPPPIRICNGCKSEIKDGISMNAFNADWHPECFCCLHCRKPIAMHEIPDSRGGQFHKPCYKELCRCYVCKKKLPSNKEGNLDYKEHPFWKEKYCPSHDTDETAKCCSCERLEPCGTKYVVLADNRWLCINCMECAVMDTDECNALHMEIREFFETLNMKIQKEFPLFLVEKEALNKAEKEEKIDNQYRMVTRGICLSEEQMVTTVSKRPRLGPNNQLIDMVTETKRVVGYRVTAILILYGLPRVLTGYLSAHEMMHAYLRLNGYRNLDPVLEEGLCQVLAHMWLEPQRYASPDAAAVAAAAESAAAVAAAAASSSSSRTPPPPPPPVATTSKKGDQSDFEKRFVEFCKYQIETDESPVYGVGYKKVKQMMDSNTNNLKDTLKEIVSLSKTTPHSKV